MKNRIEALFLMVALTLSAACGETGTPIVDTPDDSPANQSDNSSFEDPVDTRNNDSEPTCEPRTECPADACGQVADGCGGQLDCSESCNCVDGAVQVPTCGACGLGQTTCAPDESGAGDCIMPVLPAGVSLDGACSSKVHFVNPEANTSGDGTREAPFQTLNEAIQSASDNDVIAYTATTGSSEPVLIDRRVHILGGYSEQFEYDASVRSTIRVEDSLIGVVPGATPTVGVRINDVSGPIVLASLDIQTANATLTNDSEHASSNVAVWAVDSDDVRIVNSRIEAGDASNSPMHDSTASAGYDGTSGENAPSGGTPGAAGLNSGCPQANGGSGGSGGSLSFAPDSGDDSSAGALGGGSGSSSNPGGAAGRSGARGSAGSDGGQGSVGSQMIAGFWFPAESARGEDGTPGRHGAGGGGGGGGLHEYTGDGTYKVGPGGGGGGAGGCGGDGGVGGLAGGASIAILLTNSALTLDASNEVFAGDGGDGQDGLQGGQGGLGGDGGLGTNRTIFSPSGIPTTIRWTSASGGQGGDGGRGGAGGGGAGGPSYGVFCSGSAYTSDSSTEISPGTGGLGGARPGSSSRAPSGPAAAESGCPG